MPAPRNYLKEYQKLLGLTPDGKIGPKTAAAMMHDLAISDKLFFAHMMGQLKHESGGFIHFRENLNYDAKGLANTWGRYSVTGKPGGQPNALAHKLSRNPKAIGNNVYANRNGNGDEASGDGYFYRGIFGLQNTGKDNIIPFFEYTGLPLDTDPDDLEDEPKLYFLAAKFWFERNNAVKLCTGTDNQCIDNVGKKVNRGNALPTTALAHHNDERRQYTREMFHSLGIG